MDSWTLTLAIDMYRAAIVGKMEQVARGKVAITYDAISDTFDVTIRNKGTMYSDKIHDISLRLVSGATSAEIADAILFRYRKYVLNTFFLRQPKKFFPKPLDIHATQR